MQQTTSRLIALCFAFTLCSSACSSDTQPLPNANTWKYAQSKTIGQDGGTLELEVPQGTIRLVVPEGALDHDENITVGVATDTQPLTDRLDEAFQALSPAVTILPHGLTFGADVEIDIPFSAGKEFKSVQVLDDASDLTWEAVPPGSFHGGTARFKVGHLSTYLVAESDGYAEYEAPAKGSAAAVLAAINQQFNNATYDSSGVPELTCAPVGTSDTSYKDSGSCPFGSLGASGVMFHAWDNTEVLPVPWVQKYEQGHSNKNSSGGIVTNWGRAALLPDKTKPPYTHAADGTVTKYEGAKDGMISVFSMPFTEYPSLGGIIYRTANPPSSLLPQASNLAGMMCGCIGDCGDDTKSKYGQEGCGCANSAVAPDGACHDYYEGQGQCTEACQDVCTNCDGSCDVPLGPNSDTTCYVRSTYGSQGKELSTFPGLMNATISTCQTKYSHGGSICYNEILVDVTDWAYRQGERTSDGAKVLNSENQWMNVQYYARDGWFPEAVMAFVTQKNYRKKALTRLETTDPTPEGFQSGTIITVRAWYNFQLIYEDRMSVSVPLLELDVLTNIAHPKPTNPFSIVCENKDDASDSCRNALYLAGIIPDKTKAPTMGIICPSDMKYQFKDDTTYPDAVRYWCGTKSPYCDDCDSGSTPECISKYSQWCDPYEDKEKKTCSTGSFPCLEKQDDPVTPDPPTPCTWCPTDLPCIGAPIPTGDSGVPLCRAKSGQTCPEHTVLCTGS